MVCLQKSNTALRPVLEAPLKVTSFTYILLNSAVFSTIRFEQHTGNLQWTVRKNHSKLRTSWAAGHKTLRQLKILPPTQWTWSSVPRSTHPPAMRLSLSRSRPTQNNAPVYCKSSSSPDSELQASKILIILLLAIIKKPVSLMNVKVFEISTSSWLNLRIV